MSSSKRQRLSEVAGLGGVSDRSLALILENVRRNPIEGEVSRHALNRASSSSVADVRTTLRLPKTTGGTFEWHILQPQNVLQKLVGASSGLKAAFEEAWSAQPCSFDRPWSLVMYFDELTPGNVLRPDNKRKTMAVYLSVRELGPQVLCHCEAWATIALVRTSVIRTIVGGWSRMLKDLVRSMFLGASGFGTAGVVLQLDRPRLLFAQLRNILADEAALKLAFDSKGASGLRPCPVCRNVVASGSDLATRDASGYLVEIHCADAQRLEFCSDADIWRSADLLRQSKDTLSSRLFMELQQSTGFNFNPDGLLWDLELRTNFLPASAFTYDPMHCVFSQGIVGTELHLFLRRCKEEVGVTYEHLRTFCKADWVWPHFSKDKGRGLHEVFSSSRARASGDGFKASASETLMVLPLVRHFAERVVAPTGKCGEELECLHALGGVVSALLSAKRGDPQGVEALAAAAPQHLRLFTRTYGEGATKPKHHYTLHLASQVRRDGMVLDAFTLERKHQDAKRAAENTDNTNSFEMSMLSRMHLSEVRALSDAAFTDGLAGPTAAGFNLTLAEAMSVKGLKVAVGDVVLLRGNAFWVGACCRTSTGVLGAVARPMRLVSRARSAETWSRGATFVHVDAEGMTLPSCWTVDGDDFVVVP